MASFPPRRPKPNSDGLAFGITVAVMLGSVLLSFVQPAEAADTAQTRAAVSGDVQRGRYLVQIGGCNDCHSAGYVAANGKLDEKHWLTGDSLGWRGPWGTTYPANLRLVADGLPEDAWMQRARSELRPPMPWFNLRDMSDDDLRSIYRYLRQLGPAGNPAPDWVPPGQEPKTPYVSFPAPLN